jgi:hypothetical protein
LPGNMPVFLLRENSFILPLRVSLKSSSMIYCLVLFQFYIILTISP